MALTGDWTDHYGDAAQSRFSLPDGVPGIETLGLDDHLVCYLCGFYRTSKADPRSRVYTVNGVDIAVTVGKGGRVVAHTIEHRLKNAPEEFELRHAILRWLDEHAPFEKRVLPLISFGPLHRASSAHVAEHRLYPHLVMVGSTASRANDMHSPSLPGGYTHPHLFVNVFELRFHYEWPISIADQYVTEAQRFVGYFYGKHVTSGQMTPIATRDDGDHDLSVTLTNEDWVDPIEFPDDCLFCERMTDEDIERRVAAFQWEIDKESSGRIAQHGGPIHNNYEDSPEERVRYHAAIAAHAVEHPELWRPFPLINLPHRLKLALCIRWNHVVRDWLRSDPRYVYKDGHYSALWTERLGGIDQTATRSEAYSGIEQMTMQGRDFHVPSLLDMVGNFADAAELAPGIHHGLAAGESETLTERDLWYE